MPGHNVLCGAARRGAAGKVASVSFLLLYRFFPSFPHAREKSGMSRETEPGKHLVAGAGLLGWSGPGGPMAGPAGMGAGAWPGRGSGETCVFLH